MNNEVTEYIQKNQEWQIEICRELRQMIFSTVPAVEERLQYGKPHYLKGGSYAAVIHLAKEKISFMLFNASAIAAENGFIRSMGKGERKVVDIIQGQEVDYKRLAELLKQTTSSL